MSKYRIEPEYSELFVEARSNIHPIEIRTQDLIEWASTLDTRDFELPPPKILMLEMQPEINVRARIHAARLS